MKKEVYLATVESTTALYNLFTRLSGWTTLLRTFAWILKFLQLMKWSLKRKKGASDVCNVVKYITQE